MHNMIVGVSQETDDLVFSGGKKLMIQSSVVFWKLEKGTTPMTSG